MQTSEKATVSAALPSADEVFVTYRQLRTNHGIPFSRRHLRDLVARGLFPAPKRLGENTIAWPLSALAAWKAARPVQQYQPPPGREPSGKRKGPKPKSARHKLAEQNRA